MAISPALSARYLLPPVPPGPTGFPRQFDDSLVTPIVDCDGYNQAVEAALATVGNGSVAENQAQKQFILVHNWWLALLNAFYRSPDLFSTDFITNNLFNLRTDGLYYLDGPARFDPQPGPGPVIGEKRSLLAALVKKAQMGVDVRIMGWIATGVTEYLSNSIFAKKFLGGVNASTLRSIAELRKTPEIGFNAITDEIAHTAGASHLKMVVIGDSTNAVGFTGGLDFQMGRWSQPTHPDLFIPPNLVREELWHDCQAKVEGPAVAALYEWFSTIWQENIGRQPVTYRIVDTPASGPAVATDIPSHSMTRTAGGTPDMPPFPIGTVPTKGGVRVQSLRTAPQMVYANTNLLIAQPPPLNFAPNGLQEFQVAIQHAIHGAQTYIYIEDQALYSTDIMSYIHDVLVDTTRPDVKVILVTGGQDPNDAAQPLGYLAQAINVGLLRGGVASDPPLTTAQLDRVRLFRRLTENDRGTGLISTVDNLGTGTWRLTVDAANVPAQLFSPPTAAIPANFIATTRRGQVQIGNDRFPIVAHPQLNPGGPVTFDVQPGAFGVFTLSFPVSGPFQLFFMDALVVHAKITIIDDACAIVGSANCMQRSLYTDLEHSVIFVEEGTTAIRDFRSAIWADQFRSQSPADFADIQAALHSWNGTWGTAGTAPPRPPHLIQVDLPIVADPLTSLQVDQYRTLFDADSRQEWGGVLAAGRIGAGNASGTGGSGGGGSGP